MRPLTDECPKPMLDLAGKPLIHRHIERLAAAGFGEIVINLAWLGGQIRESLGDGADFGVSIRYSDEGDAALETGGGINKALPLLGDEPFLLVNGDVWSDIAYHPRELGSGDLAHLVLVPNPAHNSAGDFVFADGRAQPDGSEGARYTFSGVSVLHPELIRNAGSEGAFPLAPLLREAIRKGEVSAELHDGNWVDIGTPERLKEAASLLR